MITRQPEVFKLLVTFMEAAANKNGSAITLCFPKNLGLSGEDIFLDPQNVLNTIRTVPPIETLQDWICACTLRENLEPNVYSLLQWLVGGCQTHIQLLQPYERFAQFSTTLQFRLTLPVDQETVFARNKAELGSFYCFHGSAFENWHSILRLGVRNFNLRENEKNTPLLMVVFLGTGFMLPIDLLMV